jgi:hypothetical protein
MKYNFKIFQNLQEVEVFCAKNINKIEVISLVPNQYYGKHDDYQTIHHYKPMDYLLTYKNIEK